MILHFEKKKSCIRIICFLRKVRFKYWVLVPDENNIIFNKNTAMEIRCLIVGIFLNNTLICYFVSTNRFYKIPNMVFGQMTRPQNPHCAVKLPCNMFVTKLQCSLTTSWRNAAVYDSTLSLWPWEEYALSAVAVLWARTSAATCAENWIVPACLSWWS